MLALLQAAPFTVFDENATDNTDKVKKTSSFGTLQPALKPQPKFSVFSDHQTEAAAPAKPRRQALAPIPQSLEDSACSFTSVNTSLHQSDFVLQHRIEDAENPFKIQV